MKNDFSLSRAQLESPSELPVGAVAGTLAALSGTAWSRHGAWAGPGPAPAAGGARALS